MFHIDHGQRPGHFGIVLVRLDGGFKLRQRHPNCFEGFFGPIRRGPGKFCIQGLLDGGILQVLAVLFVLRHDRLHELGQRIKIHFGRFNGLLGLFFGIPVCFCFPQGQWFLFLSDMLPIFWFTARLP